MTRDSVLTWCAGLRYSSPPDQEGTIVEIRPSTRNLAPPATASHPAPGASEARAVVLVSCHAFAGQGPWMSPEEEGVPGEVEANGRLVARLGAEVEEPWRIG